MRTASDRANVRTEIKSTIKGLNIKKAAKIAAIVIILLLATFIIYSLRLTAEKAEYISYSTGDRGVKALYLLTGEMGFETERYEKSARFLPEKSTLVIVYPDEESINDKMEVKYLHKWIEAGNTLFIVSDRDTFINYNIAGDMKAASFGSNSNSDLIAGHIGKGWLLLYDAGEELLNEHIGEVSYAVGFLKALSDAGNKRIYFNEYYHGLTDGVPLVLEIIGPTGRLILLQLLIALVTGIIIAWRRFGKPVEVFENIKRMENENLTAISNLYIKSRAERIVLGTYLAGFRSELSRYLGLEDQTEDLELSAAAASDRLLKSAGVGSLFEECKHFIASDSNSYKKGKDTKRMLQLVERIENIRREIK